VQYRVQFLDRSANVVSEMHSFALSVAYVIDVLTAMDWPRLAVGLRILDRDDHAVKYMSSSARRSA
jgi:hypothetical protein